MTILTSVLTMMTMIQPLICIHPVIIWSQASKDQSGFPLLVVFIWFLPLLLHPISKVALRYLRPICTGVEDLDATHSVFVDPTKKSGRCGMRPITFDISLGVFEIVLIVFSFTITTHHIVGKKFFVGRGFVITAAMAVFFWMACISYLLLSIIMDGSKNMKRLIFQDQGRKNFIF